MRRFSKSCLPAIVCVILLLAGFSPPAVADVALGRFSPLQIGLFPPIQIIPEAISVYGISAGVLHVRNHNVFGVSVAPLLTARNNAGILQAAVLRAETGGSSYGVQFSGWDNLTAGDHVGIQLGLGLRFLVAVWKPLSRGYSLLHTADLGNTTGRDFYGVQLAPFANVTHGDLGGLQVGLVNLGGGRLVGIQAGLVNQAGGNLYGRRPTANGGGIQAGLFNSTEADFIGIQLAGFANSTADSAILQVAGFRNVARSFLGIQASFFYNDVAETFSGVQAALVNFTGAVSGASFGLVNVNTSAFTGLAANLLYQETSRMSGLQIGLANFAKDAGGVQIGLVNSATRMQGLQVGVLNIADRMLGVQLGGMNFIMDNTLAFMVGLNMSFRMEEGGVVVGRKPRR